MAKSSGVTGLADVQAALGALPGNIAKGTLRSAVRRTANRVASRAQENFAGAVEAVGGARSDTLNPHTLSGALRASIRVVERRGTPTRVVFQVMAGGMTAKQQKTWGMDSAYYSLWVERGHINRKMGQALRGSRAMVQHYRMNSTSNTPAHPYLAPAAEAEASAFVGDVSDVITQGIAPV